MWRRTGPVLAYIVAVDAITIALTLAAIIVVPFTRTDLSYGAILVAAAIIYVEASRPIERIRERVGGTPHIDLNSTWTFAATILLHPALIAVVVAIVFGHRWLRVRHHVVHRQVFSAAVTVISSYAGAAAIALHNHYLANVPNQDHPGGTHSIVGGSGFATMPRDAETFLTIGAAGVVYVLVNTVLICIVIAMTQTRPTLRTVTAGWEDYALELATVALAILVAWTLVDWPAALALVFGVALVLHGKVLLPQWRQAARTDTKTGLLNDHAWTTAATTELAHAQRAGQPVGLLMIDLDRFKLVNDVHGHLVGDECLLYVAIAISGELRDGDHLTHGSAARPSPRAAGRAELVGRFGGEEFLVLLPGADARAAQGVAERIRRRIAALAIPVDTTFTGITVSVGVAASPDHGHNLTTLLAAADQACYSAKASGRNRVRLSPTSSAG